MCGWSLLIGTLRGLQDWLDESAQRFHDLTEVDRGAGQSVASEEGGPLGLLGRVVGKRDGEDLGRGREVGLSSRESCFDGLQQCGGVELDTDGK